MAERPNFHSLAGDEPRRVTKTFTHARYPGLAVPIQLAEPDANTRYLAAELSGVLQKRYLTGDTELGMPAQPFLVDGKPRKITPDLCDDVALTVALQPDPWDLEFPRYEPEEILMLAFKRRLVWEQVRTLTAELYYAAEVALPNA
jgi:hypothetical protein